MTIYSQRVSFIFNIDYFLNAYLMYKERKKLEKMYQELNDEDTELKDWICYPSK